ncbi:MAG TPA: thiamine phosphate synthase [Nitrospirota bacterium]|nr:thiamine phosphate synthase [Nitrospirota bacterium]
MAVDFKLYLITDRKQTRIPLPDAVRLALKGGVRAVQLREKDLPIRELLAVALELRMLTGEFGAKLFINDRVDVAVAVEADGVHLGHQSMPPEAVRKIVGSRMLIGVSTHNREEAFSAEKNGADFITFGPIFPTPSKMKYGAPVGVEALREAKRHIRIPVFGLGGIRPDNIPEVMMAGADGVAMISAIFAARDIRKTALEITEAIKP